MLDDCEIVCPNFFDNIQTPGAQNRKLKANKVYNSLRQFELDGHLYCSKFNFDFST